MKSLKQRIEAVEAAVPTGLCYECSLKKLIGDSTIGETCPHPERITYEEALAELYGIELPSKSNGGPGRSGVRTEAQGCVSRPLTYCS